MTWVYFTLSCSPLFVIDAKTEFSAPQLSAASSQFFSSVEIFQHFPPTYEGNFWYNDSTGIHSVKTFYESFTSFYLQWYSQLDKVLLTVFWFKFRGGGTNITIG